MRPVYKEGETAKARLQAACRAMHKLIHCKQKPDDDEPSPDTECVNKSDYHLIIYYSGHSKKSEHGSWAPTEIKDGNKCKKDWISWKDVQQHTAYIRGFKNIHESEDGCSNCMGSCMYVKN